MEYFVIKTNNPSSEKNNFSISAIQIILHSNDEVRLK